jgi:class 3 adenylate cyclase
MIIVHYEVYVLEGRGWMLHARFPRTERETAIAEAKELEHTLKIKVRVIRETYYSDNNAFEEAEVYISPGVRGAQAQQRAATSGKSQPAAAAGGKASWMNDEAPARSGGGKRPAASRAQAKPVVRAKPAKTVEEEAEIRQIVVRMLGIAALSLTLALGAIKLTPEAIVLLWKMGFSMQLSPDGYNQLLIFVFALTFLMTAVPLAMKFMPRKAKVPVFHKPSMSWGGGRKPAPVQDKELKKSVDKLAAEAMREMPAFAEETAKADDPKDLDGLPPIFDDDLPPILAAADEPEAPMSFAEEKKPEKAEAGGQSAESQAPAVTRYLDGALDYCRANNISMDAYNKFALHLYLAGAIESLGEFRKIGASGRRDLLGKALNKLGTSGDLAEGFHDKLPEYLREPRYMAVAQAGREAMGNFLLGDVDGAHLGLRDVFTQWNRKGGEAKGQMMTVLFTDMVGSTDMTQAKGDAAAQEIVRRHNLIVRGALSKYGGREVKHTGDGIMASFYSATGAIDAVVAMQKQVTEHNQRMPSQELHLRIGLNAGEPIQEEDDLFGSTVQLAARVCAATNTDEILCTASVVELSGKPKASFRAVGAKHMKGFKDAIPLYEIPWR